jgi:ferrous iron transport protein A
MLFRRRGHGQYRHGHHRRARTGLYLGDLQPGQRARILHVGGRGRVRRRFMEMGLVRGETILVERVAPLGDPVEFLVKGYHVSLRRDDARQIEVQMLGAEGEGSV